MAEKDKPEPLHDVLSNDDVATLNLWARQISRMSQVFNDDRTHLCRAAGELIQSITTKR